MYYKILTSYEEILEGIELWNNSVDKMVIREELIKQNVFSPFSGVNVVGMGGFNERSMVSFVLLKYLTLKIKNYCNKDRGWISLLAVDRDKRNKNILWENILVRAENFLQSKGCKNIYFGGDPQNFIPGLPHILISDYLSIFKKHNYTKENIEYDLYANIKDYEYQHEVINSSRLKLMRVEKNLQEELFTFLQKYFPGRWLYEAQNIARIPGGVEDYRILRYKNKVVGFIRANRSTSTYQGPNVNWGNYYSSQYCGFGPLGIAPQFRGNGWGLYMISKLIKEFKKEGYIHCFIDWTTLVEYYKKLGFEPIFQFLPLKKILEG